MNEFIPILQDALIGTATAAVYSIIFFLKKRSKKVDNPLDIEKFSKSKFVATVIVGAFVGLAMSILGMEITRGDITTTLATYVGAIALVESICKAIWRRLH